MMRWVGAAAVDEDVRGCQGQGRLVGGSFHWIISVWNGLFSDAKYASGVAKQRFETVVHVLLDVAVKQG